MIFFCFFFFKQKTAYEMRISDGSSDVCASYLKTIVQGGVRGRVSIDPTPQGLSCPGKAICGPMTRSGLRTGGQNRRIDQAGRYGLVAGFLVLGTLGVPGGCIGEAGAYVRHQIAQGAEAGKDALDVGLAVGRSEERRVGEEGVRTGRHRWSP